MSEWLCACASREFAFAKREGNYLQTHAVPSQVLTFVTIALASLNIKISFKDSVLLFWIASFLHFH